MTGQRIEFFVPGHPVGQGSKRHVGHGVMIESSPRTRPWRATVTAAAIEARGGRPAIIGPVWFCFTSTFARPASHFGTGRNAGVLRPGAPAFPATRASGDADKLTRAIFDALTDAGVWRDDAQVCTMAVGKRWVEPDGTPGAHVALEPA